MSNFLDASVLVEACLSQSPSFAKADALIQKENVTSAHALAETYATLSGDKRLRIRPKEAAQMVADLADHLTVETLSPEETVSLIRRAPDRGTAGGSIYDALHAAVAKKRNCRVIHTLNVTHFRHVAAEMRIQNLD